MNACMLAENLLANKESVKVADFGKCLGPKRGAYGVNFCVDWHACE